MKTIIFFFCLYDSSSIMIYNLVCKTSYIELLLLCWYELLRLWWTCVRRLISKCVHCSIFMNNWVRRLFQLQVFLLCIYSEESNMGQNLGRVYVQFSTSSPRQTHSEIIEKMCVCVRTLQKFPLFEKQFTFFLQNSDNNFKRAHTHI